MTIANETILLITTPDDWREQIAFMFEIALRRQSHIFNILTAKDIGEGLHLAESQQIDLIFVLDRYSAAYKDIIKTLRANPLTSQLPIMLYKITLNEADAQEIGVDACFTMPVNFSALPSFLKEFLTRRKTLL